MEFRTVVQIPKPSFQIEPLEAILFVGSCFADSIGQRFREEHFPVTINPFGTMYNPASVLHTILRLKNDQWTTGIEQPPRVAFITLGTNHIYRLKETGEIVDNCEKRPQRLFQEEELSVDECAAYLLQVVEQLHSVRADMQVVFTVSPIRYQKYGFHASQLSKATLLLAVDRITHIYSSKLTTPLPPAGGVGGEASYFPARGVGGGASYFPAYELVLDELRDYRFYKEDMLHPSAQAVTYIWQQLVAHYFSPRAQQFLKEWKPVKEALAHRPFHPESEEYQRFLQETKEKEAELLTRFGKS